MICGVVTQTIALIYIVAWKTNMDDQVNMVQKENGWVGLPVGTFFVGSKIYKFFFIKFD